jgi:Beta-L-arabinofuranosidase, GH127
MYSLSYLYQALGDSSFADRTELAAFNALPIALTPDWWAHQYLTQPNQPAAKLLEETPFWNVNGWGQTYGLEPNYPCCTVNHPQGYPKFLSAMFVGVGQNGLAHALLGPGKVETTLPSGVRVKVSCLTNYPFSNAFTYSIDSSAPFDFNIRIPGWHIPGPSSGITISTFSSDGGVKTQSLAVLPNEHTRLHTLTLPAGTSSISLTLSHDIKLEHRANASIAVRAGPLLYALQIPSYNTSTSISQQNSSSPSPVPASLGPTPSQVRNYQIFPLPSSSWNVAIDPSTLTFHTSYRAGEREPELPNPLWADGVAPTWIEGRGCLIDWPTWKGGPGPVPLDRRCLGGSFGVKLIPYGGAKVHMSELPTVDLGGG